MDDILIKLLSFYSIISAVCDASHHAAWVCCQVNSKNDRIKVVDYTMDATSNHTLFLS